VIPDNRPVGIFDSGLGGLTVAKEIYLQLSNESTIYIGDTARVPYGNRSPETIREFSLEITRYFHRLNVKAVVVACATASSVALDYLRNMFPDMPIIGVIESSCKDAVKTTRSKNIGIIGTRATVNSQSFDRLIHKLDPQIKTQTKACPLFVPIIEEGMFNNQILDYTIDYYLNSFKTVNIDTLILGCTHYPLIKDAINRYFPNISQINVGTSVARHLTSILTEQSLIASTDCLPTHQYFVTDNTPNFADIANNFLGKTVEIQHLTL